jgi:hypothetical protein
MDSSEPFPTGGEYEVWLRRGKLTTLSRVEVQKEQL